MRWILDVTSTAFFALLFVAVWMPFANARTFDAWIRAMLILWSCVPLGYAINKLMQ